MTLLTIIIPHYNRPKEIKELLESIPSRPDIEIIIIDDHSDDPLKLHLERSITLYQLPSCSRYAGAARNLGLRRASGTWVFFADSDDLIITQDFAIAVDKLRYLKSDVVQARVDSFKENGEQGRRHIRYENIFREAEKDATILVKWYPPWGKFYNRNFLVQNNIQFQDSRVSNDVMFSAKAAILSSSITLVDSQVYAVRESDVSLTNDHTICSIQQRIEVLIAFNGMLKDCGLRKYQTPAFSQIRKILMAHPIKSVKLMWMAFVNGSPLFLRYYSVFLALKRYFR